MKLFLRSAVLVALACVPLVGGLFAQGGPPVGGPPPCWPPPCIPIDGGLSFLLGAGALFGGKRLLDIRRERKLAGE